MANKDDQDTDKDLDQDLDTDVDDDSQDDADAGDDDQDTDDNQDTDDDQDDDGDGAPEFKKRYTQFKGETPAEYAGNLEDAYSKSSTEAVKLAKQVKELQPVVDRIQALIATNPELAKQLGQTAPSIAPADKKPENLDPDIAWAKGERQRQWAKELNAFKTDHPEIEADPALAEDLNNELAVIAEAYQRRNGYGISMAEGLKKAWVSLGYENAPSKQERIASAAKNDGTKGKSQTGRQGAPKVKLSEAQISAGMEMLNLGRSETIKKLSAYAK